MRSKGAAPGGSVAMNHEVRHHGRQVSPIELEGSDLGLSASAVLDRSYDGLLHVVPEPRRLHHQNGGDRQHQMSAASAMAALRRILMGRLIPTPPA